MLHIKHVVMEKHDIERQDRSKCLALLATSDYENLKAWNKTKITD